MGDPWALVDHTAEGYDPPEKPDVGVGIPSFQPPDPDADPPEPPPGAIDAPAGAPPPAKPTPPPAAPANEAKKNDEEAAKKKAEEEAKKKAEEEAKKKAEEEAKKKAEEEAKKKAEEEAKKKAEEEAKKKAEEEANRRAEEAKRQAEEESKKAAMASRAPEPMAKAMKPPLEAKKKEEEEKKRKADEDAKKKAEGDAKNAGDAKKAEEEAKKKAEEAKRQAEEESKKAAMASRAPEPMAAASPVVQTPPSQLQFPQQAVGFGGFMPPSYPNSPAPRTDGVSEREMEREVENVRREMIAKSEKQIEDVKSLMTQQLEALRNELRDERERRGADALKMSQQEMARDMDMKMKLTEKFSEFDRMRSELQSQYAEQVRQNQDLQRKILEKEMKMEVDFQRRLDEFRQKQDGQSKEVLLASLKKELDEEGRMAELAERSRQLKQEYERKLAQDHEDQQVRLNVLEQRMAAQHRANIIDLLRREQGDREWLQSLAWDHFSSLKRDESQARVQLLQTRQTATSLLAVAPGVGAQGQMVTAAGAAPASLAARGLNALSQHAARTPAPYTTKSFKKVYDVLERLDLAQNYAAVFAANEFDIMCLASLTEEDLNLLGITALGARKKLLAEAEVLRNEMTLNPPPPAAQERSGAVDDELTAEWCKERMARLACAHTPEAYDDVLAWDDAWREACALDADGEPSGHAGGHRGALLVQCISGAPPPRSRASPARKQLQQAAPLPPPSPPRPLPVPQHVLVFHTSDGIPYYYNEVTRETTWTPPAY